MNFQTCGYTTIVMAGAGTLTGCAMAQAPVSTDWTRTWYAAFEVLDKNIKTVPNFDQPFLY